MTKKSIILTVGTLIIALYLAGCGLFQSDTTQLKGLLEDKYGEKFEIKSYYYDGDMWAMCYPINDPSLLFQVRTDEHAERIKHDYYLQTVVARQVEEEYGPLVQQAFPGSYLSVNVWATDYEGQTADKVTLDSMLQYRNSGSDDEDDAWTHIIFNIFVDISQISETNLELEYALFTDEIGCKISNGKLPDTIVKLYFGNSSFVKECKTVIEEMTWSGSSDIYVKTEGCPELWGGYDDSGKFTYTLDEYIEKREEVLSNE